MEIRELKTEIEIREAIALCKSILSKFIAPEYSRRGQENFSKFVRFKSEQYIVEINKGEKKDVGLLYKRLSRCHDGYTRNVMPSLPAFVDWRSRVGMGLTAALWSLTHRRLRPVTYKITVNASPYALKNLCPHGAFVPTAPKSTGAVLSAIYGAKHLSFPAFLIMPVSYFTPIKPYP